jgi:DNA primase
MPLSRFLIESASADCDLTTAEGRARMATQARPLWSALPDGALKRQLIGDLAEGIGLGATDLLQLWQQAGPGGRTRRTSASPAAHPGDDSQQAAGPDPYPPYEDVGHLRKDYGSQGGGEYGSGYGGGHGSGYGGGSAGSGDFGKKRFSKYRREAPPPRMLGSRTAVASRADRAVGLLLANAQAWDSLTNDDHSLLAHLAAPHGPVVAWLDAQFHEHGPQPWAALREALRGHGNEVWACAQVEQVLLGNDADAELTELAGIMAMLREDDLKAQAEQLAQRVQQGDTAAYEEFKRISTLIKALKTGPQV